MKIIKINLTYLNLLKRTEKKVFCNKSTIFCHFLSVNYFVFLVRQFMVKITGNPWKRSVSLKIVWISNMGQSVSTHKYWNQNVFLKILRFYLNISNKIKTFLISTILKLFSHFDQVNRNCNKTQVTEKSDMEWEIYIRNYFSVFSISISTSIIFK